MNDYPLNYQVQNASATKQLNVVVEFEGSDTKIGLLKTFKKLRWGEPGYVYGMPGVVWGGLIPDGKVLPYIDPKPNMTITQKLEPEQGRGSAGTFSMTFQDQNGFMTNFVTPGKVFNDILGGKLVKIRIGYQNTSYPEDYFVVFRGYVSSVTCQPTTVMMQFTDANLKRRQQAFSMGKGVTDAAVKAFTPADVNTATDTITILNHGYTEDTKLTFGASVSLPGGIEFGTEYFVRNPSTNTLQLSRFWKGAIVDITTTGAGNLQAQGTKITGTISYGFQPSNVDAALNKFNIDDTGIAQNLQLRFSTAGILPGGIVAGQTYFALALTENSFQVSLTPSGTPVDITSQGQGQHFVTLIDSPSASVKIPMAKTDGFLKPVLGPDGLYDQSIRFYIKIGDEFMQYEDGDVVADGITVTRGARGTLKEEIELGADVENFVELEGNPVDLALKIMLSGWGGPCITGIQIHGFNTTGLLAPLPTTLPNAIILPDGVNAVEDYGLAPGGYLYVTGSLYNNTTFTINTFGDLNGYPNKVVFVNETVTDEQPTAGVMSHRSQYDTFPAACANKLKTWDVDIAQWQDVRLTFLFHTDDTGRILIDAPISTKELIEKEFLLPGGAYSVTRFGKLSVIVTKPPMVDGRSIFLDSTNIVDPEQMSVQRATNTRRFFNEIQYEYDYDDDGESRSVLSKIDSDSVTIIDVSSVLPIKSKMLKTDLGAEAFIARRSEFIIRRYKDAAIEIKCKTNWQAASLMQPGDVIPLYDNGKLKIPNLETGERNLGSQLFEVIDWSLDMKSATANVTLLTQAVYQIDDRFATISPSSLTDIGSTTTRLKFKDAFGGQYPGNEKKKWEGLEGEPLRIRNYDFTFTENTTFIGIDPGDPYAMLIDPPLSAAPPADFIIDIADYAEPDPVEGSKLKLSFAHLTPTLAVVSGVDTLSFNVSLSDAARVTPELPVLIRSSDWSIVSKEAKVDSVVGTLVTLKTAIEFTPSAGQFVELVGFTDGGGPYRIL